MKIFIRAGSLLKSGPERDLVDDYLKRAGHLTRQTGFHSITETQVDLRHEKTRQTESQKILGGVSPHAKLIVLDERGRTFTSRQVAKKLADWRDDNISELVFAIGGADGFDPTLIPKTAEKWALGPMTWPHKMVRVMIAEQIYRALSILAGTPYHRD